ncbi:MAG TPA: TIGR02186 family protein [Bauldia sp.]|nr:TIGR02186 family protein [Bauldia sp.]
MRRALATLALLGAAAAGSEARAEKLTVALSTEEIRIDSNFTGASVTVFGVIERDAITVSRASPYEVAVTLRGQPETVVARRKDPILGIWINRAAETFVDVPSFYAVVTSKPLEEISTAQLLTRFGVGLDYIPFSIAGETVADTAGNDAFREAFVRLKEQSGLYSEDVGGVTSMGEAVFRATIGIPANVPTGRYTLTVHLFSGDALIAQADESLEVIKTGFEQYMFTAAHERAALYGLACVALALFAGWLAGVIFRRD